MHWNYRIAEFKNEKGESIFKLVEAYYSKDEKKKTVDKVTSWCEASEVEAESLEELANDIRHKNEALVRPILKIKEKIKVDPKKDLAAMFQIG